MRTPAERLSYDPRYFAPLFAIEDRHFWFRARNEVIGLLAKQLTGAFSPGYRVLEVGCGTGNVLRVLESACEDGTVVGMDLFAEGLTYARRRATCALVQADVGHPPFDARFQLIGLFDVLEHLPDDLQTLRDLRALLSDGGALLLTVPARASLWSYFDQASHHCRRYEAAELASKLRAAGFEIEYLSSWMMTVFPLVWLGRRVAAISDRRPALSSNRSEDLAERELRIIPVLNGILTFILRLEARVIARRGKLPVGSSLLAIARRIPADDTPAPNRTSERGPATWLHYLATKPRVYDVIQRLVGGGVVHKRLAGVANQLGGSRLVLDLGGGTGSLRDLWPASTSYVCLDLDPVKLRGFRQKYPDGGALLADGNRVPVQSGSVDVVCCVAVTHHLTDEQLDGLVSESHRVLKPTGTLVFLDAVWEPTRWTSRLLWHYDRGGNPRSAEVLKRALRRHFVADAEDSFAVLHEYLLWVGRPAELNSSRVNHRDDPKNAGER